MAVGTKQGCLFIYGQPGVELCKEDFFSSPPLSRIMAVGTKQGCLCIYGQPGVELSSSHESGAAVLQLFFLPGQGRIVALLEDNMLHLWQVG